MHKQANKNAKWHLAKHGKKIVIAIAVVVALILLSIAAYFLAGVIVLIAFKHNPTLATWTTLLDAYQTIEPGTKEFKKLKGCVLLAVVLSFGAPFGLVMAMLNKKKQDIHGKARFANKKEIEAQGFMKPKGIIVGKMGDQFLRFPGTEFLLVAAPTRSGKGISTVIPNLLTFEDSAVVLDIKCENYNLTSAYRRQHLKQKIFYFNPFSENTHRWNPLSYIPKDPNFRVNGLMALATIIYKPDPKNPFWSDSARNLFVGLGLLVSETPMLPQTIGEMLRQASGKGMPIKDYMEQVIAVRAHSDKPLSASCIDCLNRFLNNSEETLRNVISSFTAPLSLWANPVIDKATSADDFDLRNVRKQRMTIYLCISPDNMVLAEFILNIFFSQLINENIKELPEHNPALKYQCLMLMDEFTAMGKVAIIAKGVGFMAGYNLRLLIIIQDKTQLESAYGKEDAHSIAINMGAKIYFTPSEVQEAKAYSEVIGYDTVTTRNASHANIGLMNAGRYSLSESEQLNKKAVMLPQELLQMPQTEALIHRPGIPIIKSAKIRYYEDEYLNQLFLSVPTQEVVINGEARTVPVPLPLPVPHWAYYNSTKADTNYYLEGDFDDLTDADPSACLEAALEIENSFTATDSDGQRDQNLRELARQWFNAAKNPLMQPTPSM